MYKQIHLPHRRPEFSESRIGTANINTLTGKVWKHDVPWSTIPTWQAWWDHKAKRKRRRTKKA